MSDINELISRQLSGAAGELVPVDIESLDEPVRIYVRKLDRVERQKALSYARTGGDPAESIARASIAGIRWAAVDEDGNHLFGTYEAAARFINAIEDDEYDRIGDALKEATLDAGGPEAEEAGKGS